MSAMKIKIRAARPEDAQDILSITREAFEKYAFDLGQPERVTALKEDTESITRDIARKNVLVGELDGVPVGSVRYEFLDDGVCYFSRFGVRLVAQSCGMGGALVNAVIEACKSAGQKAIALHTSAKMYSLIRFYYGRGFFIHSTTTDRGYLRALLIKELNGLDTLDDYRAMIPLNY